VHHAAIEAALEAMAAMVRAYVPGYRLKQKVQFETFGPEDAVHIPETGKFWGTRVTVLLAPARRTTCRPTPATSTS
jgi:acetaldehyde dehydrogenase